MDERTLEEIIAEPAVEVVIDDYGYTGEGYVRLADGWLSVAGALPAERVRVRVEADVGRGRRVFGQLDDVVEASAARRDPLCKRDAVCRGCQLRQATVDEELRFHVRTVGEVIEKFGDIPQDDQPPIELITPQPIARGDAYRVRSALTYRRVDATGAADDGRQRCELGLVSPVQRALVPMVDCPALTTPVKRLVATVEQTFDQLDTLPWDESMARRAAANGQPTRPAIRTIDVASPVIGRGLVDVRLDEISGQDTLERAVAQGAMAALLNNLEAALPEAVGLAVSVGQARVKLKGPDRLRLPLGGLRMEVGYDDWFPATLTPSDVLYSRLMELVELKADDTFLDVGSGIGTISLLAAARCQQVVGVDSNRHSVATAELNAMENSRDNAEFVVGGWENALRRLTLAGRKFRAATINPMREPLGRRALSYLDKMDVARVVYLGPSPAAAAKDIGELGQMGWTLDYLAAANIHPATYHTMLVARLEHV